MPTLANHPSQKRVKVLYLGHNGTGKSGSLESLVRAGYRLVILDCDDGLDVLFNLVLSKCPDKAGNVYFKTVTDKRKNSKDPRSAVEATGWEEAMKLLNHWKTADEDLGRPADWDENTILVIDSLTFLSTMAFNYAHKLNPGVRDNRQIYQAAQEQVRSMLGMLFSTNFPCHVVVTSHINYLEINDGMVKGFPSTVGRQLGQYVGRFFNGVIKATTRGSGSNVKRKITTVPEANVDLKNPDPLNMPAELDLENGLAEYFRILTNTANQERKQ